MEQRFAAAFGFFAFGLAFGGLFKEIAVVVVQRLGRAIQVGTGLTSGLWAIGLALTSEQYDFASIPIGFGFLAAFGVAGVFAGVVLITDILGGLKPPDLAASVITHEASLENDA